MKTGALISIQIASLLLGLFISLLDFADYTLGGWMSATGFALMAGSVYWFGKTIRRAKEKIEPTNL